MRGWITPHPNVNLYVEDDITRCPSCGDSENLKWGETKPYVTQTNVYETCRCGNCGTISRSRVTATSKSKRHSLIMSVAK